MSHIHLLVKYVDHLLPHRLLANEELTYGIYIFQCAKNNSKMDLECMHDTCTSLYVFIHHSFHTEVSYIKMPF